MKSLRLIPVIIFSIWFITGCERENTDKKEQDNAPMEQSELIREQGTDVSALDINNDGVVYQCPMDYQVIADTVETCPVCKMDLEEYTVMEATVNLESHYKK